MRLSIQRRLLFAFLGLAVVPLLLAAVSNAIIYYRQQADSELRHLQELSLRVATQVDAGLRQSQRALDNLLLYRDLARLSASEQSRLLAELLARNPSFQEASLLDPSGLERTRRSTVEAVLGPPRDRKTETAFLFPFTTGTTYFGPLHYGGSGEPLMTLAMPLIDAASGRVEAVLTAELRLDSLWEQITQPAPAPGLDVYVLDEHAHVVAHRDPSVVLRETTLSLPTGPHVGTGLGGDRAFVADSNLWAGQRLFRVVAEHQWSHAMAPAVGNLIALGGVLLLALAVAFAAASHVLRRIVHPIMSVERTARAVAAGDLAQRVSVGSEDEIGDLAASFNAMTEHLQHTLGALQGEVEVRQKAEQSLRASESYLQRLLQHLPTALIVHDADGTIRYGNPAALEFLGLNLEQLRGKSPLDPDWHFVNDEGSPMPVKDFPVNRVLAERRPLHNYLVGVAGAAGAPVRWAYVDAFPELDEDGALRLVIVTFVDITQRKLAETELRRHREQLETLVAERTAALRESETRYRTVANFTNDWETWLGEDNRYRYISPSCERITGYRAEEFLADPGRLLNLIHPDDRPRFAAHLELGIAARQGERLEFRLTRRDGVTIWIEHICQPVFEGGRYLGTRASNRDISERKQQALDLARARDEAQAANRAKSVFLANMSHELRTPMNAILGFSQLLATDPALDEEHLAKIRTISRSGHHLLTLINDVLEISKIEAGKITCENRAFDLVDLCDSIEDVIRLRAEQKGLAVEFEISPDVPHYFSGDDKKLRQVLLNLMGNAVKFTSEGHVRLRVTTDPEAAGRIRFEVSDTGCGIPPAEQARIFEAFYQTPDSSRRGEGTGLGLTISRQYVSLMGGRLQVESEPGKGALFRFSVPLQVVPSVQVEKQAAGRRVTGIAPGQERFRILIAEDRVDSRILLQQLLESAGFDVRAVENGEQALNMVQSWHPHLVWMDMRMPVMDGYEATRRIKATPAGHETVVLALTASAFEEDRAEVLATGCDGFLRKPLDVDEVFAAMGQHLGVRYRYEEEAPRAPPAGHAAAAPDRAAYAALPAERREAIAHAALVLDPRLAHAAIAEIAGQAPELAAALNRLVDEYRFDELLNLSEVPTRG